MEFCVICDEVIHRGQEVVDTPMGPCHTECFEDETEEVDEREEHANSLQRLS